MANTNVAYDLSMFETKPKKTQAERLQVVESVPKPRRKPKMKVSAILLISAIVAVVVLMVGYSIYGRVQLNELSAELNQINAQMKSMESENTRLEAQLSSQNSLQWLENEATKLGLGKTENYHRRRQN